MHHPGQRRIRSDLRARRRQNQWPSAEQPQTHPLCGTDRRRIFLHRNRREERRHVREHERNRTPRLLPLLRTRGKSRRYGDGRVSEQQIQLKYSAYGSKPACRGAATLLTFVMSTKLRPTAASASTHVEPARYREVSWERMI